ncbi:MAG: hypothetical protein ACKV22_33065 [Bryobacteraceae bacterium]
MAEESLTQTICSFLRGARSPAVLEPGEPAFEVAPEAFEVSERNGRVLLHAWTDGRNLARRVLQITARRRDRMELQIERLGGKRGKLWLVDQAHAAAVDLVRRGMRMSFQSEFQQWLARQYPGWRVKELTTEPDLEHSLSPVFPRALLLEGQTARAAMAAPETSRPGDVLTFALIWLDHVRGRNARLPVDRLILFVPSAHAPCLCQRIRFLDPLQAPCELYAYGNDGSGQFDLADFGNLETRLEPVATTEVRSDLAQRLSRIPHARPVTTADGGISIRVCGLEIAHVTADRAWYGLDRREPLDLAGVDELESLAAGIARRRDPRSADPRDSIYSRAPEAWLEHRVRGDLSVIDATLQPAPLYSQVPQWSARERGMLDLLAVDYTGRLVVIELKASEDLHLPLQALDYWMRVSWHLEKRDFSSRGYFPGTTLRAVPPRLLLVAPALEFHPSTESILRFWKPAIEVERIGVNAGWRSGLRVAFRLRGSEKASALAVSMPP